MKKIALIGFGAAAIGFLKGMIDNGNIKDYEIDVYEMGDNIDNAGFGGLKYDGKIFISKNMGGDLEIPTNIQREIVDFFLEKADMINYEGGKKIYKKDIEHGLSFDDEDLFKKFYNEGFEPVKSEFFHIGTDALADTVKKIYKEFENHENINFYFNSKIEKINKFEKHYTINNINKNYDHLIIAVGRRGHKLVKSLIDQEPEIVLSNNKVDLGVRFELPDHVVQELNDKMYEFKLRLKTKTGYTVRTFCNNPSGEVTLEKYDDFVTVNGHAKAKKKTKNTNFAILVTHSFTQPFNDPIGYGSYISKLSNILSGGNKVILQTYEDFYNSNRTKKIGRVEPTLSDNSYILGDLNLIFPRKTVESIIDFMEKLNNVVPGITYPDNLLYGVEVKFYGNKIDNSLFDNLKIIGDSSGWTRSITYAAAHGYLISNTL